MAAARGLVRKLLNTHRLSAMGVGTSAGFFSASAGFFSAAAVASAASGEGRTTCPAYPWRPQDGARGGQVFMQHDCAACHSMLPYAGLSEAAACGAGGQVEAKAVEIVVVEEEAQPATAGPLHGGAYRPDLTLVTKMLEGCNLYSAEELKRRVSLPTPVWLQFLQPYTRTPQAA